jgi:hypothetical protein
MRGNMSYKDETIHFPTWRYKKVAGEIKKRVFGDLASLEGAGKGWFDSPEKAKRLPEEN